MSHASNLRDNAREWDISECPERAARARAAADYIEQLEAENERLLRAVNAADERIERLEGRAS